jgi:pimeloyl-ACP methyl ester carboxylesterase
VEPSREDIWESARAIRCATLLVHGGASPVLRLDMAQRFADEVEKVRFTSIPGAGHSVAGDKPAEFTRAVLEFLAEALD